MEKYAIIETKVIHVPGDLRSQEAPGHGYPAHDRTEKTIREFETKEAWENWITNASLPQSGLPKKFRPIVFREGRVEVTSNVSINID